jgi:hypothetical protein
MVLHTFFAVPVLMDFEHVPSDHTDCLEKEAFENIYVRRNFAQCDNIEIIRDSDDFMMLSLTPSGVNWSPDGKNNFSLGTDKYIRLYSLKASTDAYIHAACDCLNNIHQHCDSVRHALFRLPIRWHAGEVDDVWNVKEREIGRMIDGVLGMYNTSLNLSIDKGPSYSSARNLLNIDVVIFFKYAGVRRYIRGILRSCYGLIQYVAANSLRDPLWPAKRLKFKVTQRYKALLKRT